MWAWLFKRVRFREEASLFAGSYACRVEWLAPLQRGGVLAITGEEVAPYVLILGLILVTASLMMKLAKRKRGGSSANGGDPKVTGAERLEKLRQEQGVRRDLDSLMVEIEEMAKRLSHQLDAKAVRLEQLIEDADHRLIRLRHVAERLEAAQQGDAETPASPVSQSSGETPAPPPQDGDLLSTSAPAAREAKDAPPPDGDDPLTRSVYALADEGYDAKAIAGRLQEHTGKVELILALRQS